MRRGADRAGDAGAGTGARYTGVSGRPLPAVSCVVIVQPLKSVPRHAVERARRRRCPTPVVYCNCAGEQVPLIEVRRRPLGVEVRQSCAIADAARC